MDDLVFGRITVHPAQRQLRVDGKLVPLGARAFDLLLALAERRDRVVSKAELLDLAWPGLVVEENNLTVQVSTLRKALGNDSIATVTGRGYRFTLSPDKPAASSSDPADRPVVASRPVTLRTNSVRLFGREPELGLLRQTLLEHRLVTVLGAGGIGKTVFARAAAQTQADYRSHGVAWVDLAPISDAALLPATLARALGLPISQGEDPLGALLAALRPLDCLLVLDNAEHLLEAISSLAASILDRAPSVHLLVTSQAPLHLESERLFRLKPLEVPGADEPLAQARLSAAVALFEDRAIGVDRDFALTEDNVGTVIRICRRLDGLPLAIRLAAGRARVLGLSALEPRLDERLAWLTCEDRDAPSRQRTLLAALQWSYGLLSAAEQRLYRQLGAFVGGFTLELAIATAREPDLDDGRIVALLDGLVERSLIDREPGDPPRFRMLESQRALALQELAKLGELDDARHRHARVFVAAIEEAPEAFWPMPDAVWLPQWLPELDNLRAAMQWSEKNAPALFASLIWSATGLYLLLGIGHELRRWADAIDARAIADLDARVAARLHLARFILEQRSEGQRSKHVMLAEHLARECGDPQILYLALCLKAGYAYVQPQAAATLINEIAALESPEWLPRLRSMRWMALYTVETLGHRWSQALRAAETGLELAIQAGATILKAVCSNAVLLALIRADDLDAALERSATLRHHVMPGPAHTVIPFLGTCARLQVSRGDLSAARVHLAEMFDLCRAVEWSHFERYCTVYFHLALRERRLESAARLVGYAEQVTPTAGELPRFDHLREAARAELCAKVDPVRLESLYAEGAKLDPEAVCNLTLGCR